MAAEALEKSALESKDKDQLMAIAGALGVKAGARDSKATLVDKILEKTGANDAPAAPALPAAFLPGEPAPALPEWLAPALETQEAVLDVGIWIVEGTDDLDESGVRHQNAFYVLLNEWFKGRDALSSQSRSTMKFVSSVLI